MKRNTTDNWQFFVQMVFGMELQTLNKRVVDINPVQIEYGQPPGTTTSTISPCTPARSPRKS